MNPEVDREYLAREGFLRDAMMLPLADNPERGLFLGIFGKQYFRTLNDFANFVAYISPCTQDWYTYKDVDAAAANLTFLDQWEEQALDNTNEGGTLHEFFLQREAILVLERIPNLPLVLYNWWGDQQEFAIVADCGDCWIEGYLADRVD